MEAILRIINNNRITDYDLAMEKDRIFADGFYAFPQGNTWIFQSDKAILQNGGQVTYGMLQVGDVLVLDSTSRQAIMVLPKVQGVVKKLLFSQSITIGRHTDNGVELKNRNVSGHHCRFYVENHRIYLEDMGSTNGTYVNDIVVLPGRSVALSQGDVVKTDRYIFQYKDALYITNADGTVVIHTDGTRSADGGEENQNAYSEKPVSPDRVEKAWKEYPWFSRAPRQLNALRPLTIDILSAPQIGEKQGMGIPGIGLNMTTMAVSLGMQALRYAMNRRKWSQQEKQRAEIYANYLTGIEKQLQDHNDQQRNRLLRQYPSVSECMGWVNGPGIRLWERHPEDEDFLGVRLGLGTVRSAARVRTPMQQLQLKSDEFAEVPGQIAQKYSSIEAAPITCNLMQNGICGIRGERQACILLAQGMIAQLAALHSYHEVKMVVLYPKEEEKYWSFTRWLPHCMNKERDIRYVACEKDEAKVILKMLETVIRERVEKDSSFSFGEKRASLPHYVFVVANPRLLEGSPVGNALMMNRPELGINGIILGQSLSDFPHSVRNFIQVYGRENRLQLEWSNPDGQGVLVTSEYTLDNSGFQRFGRRMAPIRLNETAATDKTGIPNYVTFLEGLHVKKIEEIDLKEFWESAKPEISMAVPIGVRSGGELMNFDIHEEKQGPHGIVAGGTGSGKSKMIQTWIASMVLQFSPQDVNFVLVDFKGESLLQPFRGLPHLAGSTNNNDPDVRRKFLAVESELTRRERILAQYECNDILIYRRKRRSNPAMPVMPFLILIVDEYADFKTQYPEFTAPIDHLYQAGRSLGVFAILMTQKPSGKITDQMRANLGFRWCLRVDDESDSREVLGNPDAAHLRGAGRAYVKANDGTYELIQSFYSSAPYQPDRGEKETNAQVFALRLNGTVLHRDTQPEPERREGRTELEVITAYVTEYCKRQHIERARPMWQQALPDCVELKDLLERYRDEAGAAEAGADEIKGPVAILGLADDPEHQLQNLLLHDFWNQGSLAVYGMSFSGKTTFLQTLVLSMCNSYTPQEIQFYLIECGGFGLRSLERFPHVGAAAGDDEPDGISKILELMTTKLQKRKKLFRKAGVGSPQAYADASGEVLPTVVLAIDHMNLLGQMYPDAQTDIIRLAREGMACGIYLAVTFSGTSAVNYQLVQNIRQVMTLQLADKTEYGSLVGRPANTIDTAQWPIGRGLVKTGKNPLQFQTAILFSDLSDGKRMTEIHRMAERMKEDWKGDRPQTIVRLPETLTYDDVRGAFWCPGCSYETAAPVRIDPEKQCSLMVSAARQEQIRTLYRSLLMQAQNQATGSLVLLYTKDPDSYREYAGDGHVEVLSSIEEFTRKIEQDIAPLLRERQAAVRQGLACDLTPVVVAVEGLKDFLAEAAETLVMRLEVFIRLGEGLGYQFIAADTQEEMSLCRFMEKNVLTVTMRNRARMIIGGKRSGHQLIDQQDYPEGTPYELASDEAYLKPGKQEPLLHVKLIGEEE